MQHAKRARVEGLEVRQLLTANLVADFNGIFPSDSVTLNGVSYFAANDGVHGTELWKSDGTQAGTTMVKDIAVGSGGSNIKGFTLVNGNVMFFAEDQNDVVGLYRTDGTAAGTGPVKGFGSEHIAWYWNIGTAVVGPADDQKLVFYFGKYNHGTDNPNNTGGDQDGVYATDGTAAHLIKLGADYSSGIANEMESITNKLPVTHGKVIMSSGTEMYATDGTLAGTVDLGVKSSRTVMAGDDVAMSNGATGSELYYITDGTRAGTRKIFSFATTPDQEAKGIQPWDDDAVAAGNYVYVTRVYYQNGLIPYSEIYDYNETTGEVSKVLTTAGNAAAYQAVGDQMLLMNSDAEHGQELWITDGTAANTHLLKDLTPGSVGTELSDSLAVGDVTYFVTAGVYNVSNPSPQDMVLSLWRTDGTAAGTKEVYASNYSAWDYLFRLNTVNNQLALRLEDHSEHPVKTIMFDPTQDTARGPAQNTAYIVNGILRVFGTTHDDTIRLYNLRGDPSRFVVNINGKTQIFSYASVSKTIIYGYNGNDDIGVSHKYGNVVLRSSIWGGSGNDTIYGTDGRDSIYGESGNDDLLSGAGNDVVMGGNGSDTLLGSTGSDTMDGGTGSDIVDGGSGADVLTGGTDSDADTVTSGSGADVMFGQSVLDVFYGASSADEILNSADQT